MTDIRPYRKKFKPADRRLYDEARQLSIAEPGPASREAANIRLWYERDVTLKDFYQALGRT